jgi:hypothetical protein
MKKIAVLLTLSLTPILSSAATYNCVPAPSQKTEISAGADQGSILSIQSLQINDANDLSLQITGLKGIDAANGLKPSQSTLAYKADGGNHSMLFFSYQGAPTNAFTFKAVYLEIGQIDVLTAGPIPPGTYDARLSMAFIAPNLYYKDKYPMTVKKVDFDCKATFSGY